MLCNNHLRPCALHDNNQKVVVLYFITLLLLGTLLLGLAYAAPLANTEKDWQYVNANSWAWNYSPETQINKNNVDQLEVKWVFPLQGTVTAPEELQSLKLPEGSTTPPIVVDGKVFVTTQYQRTYAIDAKTGTRLWVHDYVINTTDVEQRLPVGFGDFLSGFGGIFAHMHGIRYWENGNSLLISGLACDFYGVDAETGKTSFWVKDLCKDIPGNLYKYLQGAVSETNIGTYEKGGQFIAVLPGAMHSYIYGGDFRHTTIGVDMTTHQIVWRIFSYPPQDKPTKDWALQECDIGFFGNIPCTNVAAKSPENLEWDWAQPGQPPSQFGGVTANWGEIVVDEDTGIVYTQTGNQGPYTYIGATPGPRLYGSTIMAIDMNNGKRIWWLQPFPRDPYDYDCNWSGILADVQELGKVYMKGCKEGRLFVIDAKTGKPDYMIDLTNEQYQWGQITKAGTLEPTQGGVKYHLNDPFNHYDMRELESPDNSTYCSRPCVVYPAWSNGIFATDMSYDPATGTLFHYAVALQTKIINSPPAALGKSVSITKSYPITNTTIVARDAATGKVKWTYFYKAGQQRSHLVVTPDLVFSAFTDGFLRFLDKNTGKELYKMNLASDLRIGVTTGQDSDGNQELFTVAGITSSWGSKNPGVVIAIGLSDKAAAEVRTTVDTTTQHTTFTTTTSVTTRAASTSAALTTNTVPAQTAATSVNPTIILPLEIIYTSIAVAVTAFIMVLILVMRKRI
jgi:alcohol dehydrogenase (cytochrome c)